MARQATLSLGEQVHIDFMAVPGGFFQMGSFGHQGSEDEHPQHRVSVAPFWMSKYPVTQAQWSVLMGRNSSRFKGARLPVDNVSWKDAQHFCEKLSKQTGQICRLPSEAEWEYACRAGTLTAFSFGEMVTTEVANYNGEFPYQGGPKGVYRHTTTPVGSFPPNAFGMYDMHGNIWEWCADGWHDSYEGAPMDGQPWVFKSAAGYRVLRGGCWHDIPDVCRSATRMQYTAAAGDEITGFRVVMS